MATLSRGYTFGSTENVTNTKLHALVDSGTVTGIVNADIATGAAIEFSKIAEANIDGSKLVGLGNIVSGAGIIPVANIDKGTTANKILQLDASAKIPAVDASQVTGLLASQIPNLGASKITSETMATARLGSGTASASNFLRGDQSWAIPAGVQGGDAATVTDVATATGASNTWHDVTGASVSITLSSTGNIMATFSGGGKLNSAHNLQYRLVYDSTSIASQNLGTVETDIYQPFGLGDKAASVSAGTYTVKLQLMCSDWDNAIATTRGVLEVIAW